MTMGVKAFEKFSPGFRKSFKVDVGIDDGLEEFEQAWFIEFGECVKVFRCFGGLGKSGLPEI